MKRLLLSVWTLSIYSFTVGQVGIDNTNPQQTLHVGGTGKVRIEGLNATNNNNNLGAGQTSRVFVNEQGDLTLGTFDGTVELLYDSENYLQDAEDPNSLVNQTGTAFGYTTAGIPTDGLAATFTLTKNAILEINYSVSWSIYKTSGTSGRIPDEHARIVQTGVYLRQNNYLGAAIIYDLDGNAINSGPWCIDVNAAGTICQEQGGLLGLNGQFYNNASSTNGEYKNFHNTASDYVKLGPGTYTAMFAAQLAVGDVSGTGAVKMYLGSGKDELQIIAHYYN